MKIGVIGCGYVFDHYLKTFYNHTNLELKGVTDINMERATKVAHHYKTKIYTSNEELLADPEIEIVVNLTPPKSHYEISRAALLAGKHVYSEKPLTVSLSHAQNLVELAREKGLLLSAAPCNVLSDSVQTMWKAVRDGAVGRVQLVYAEFDDNPIYLMKPEGWRSTTGAPWPYLNEFEEGCTLEHAGYHLSWLVAMFGPAKSVTAFSSCLVPDKTPLKLDPPDTPDFSVACIVFQSGVVARLTCSIIAPLDHQITIIGNDGMIRTNTYRHYRSPVYIERFSQLTLNARKSYSVRTNSILQNIFGVGGRKQRLVNKQQSQLAKLLHDSMSISTPVKKVKARELGAQDKCLGIAEMVNAIENNRECLLPPDFVLHVTELTLAISNAGIAGQSYKPKTSCKPLSPKLSTLNSNRIYNKTKSTDLLTSTVDKLIERLHKH